MMYVVTGRSSFHCWMPSDGAILAVHDVRNAKDSVDGHTWGKSWNEKLHVNIASPPLPDTSSLDMVVGVEQTRPPHLGP